MPVIPTTVEQVVKSGMCVGCGICASLAKPGQVEMGYGLKGFRRPLVREPLTAEQQKKIMDVCPGANLEGPGPRPDAQTVPLWGPVKSLDRSWASDDNVRFHGAGGGTMTALANFLLDTGRADAILHVKAEPGKPWQTISTISRTNEEVWEASQSRYGTSSPLERLRELMDSGERFAVMAKPCDISSVNQLVKRDPKVAEQVVALVTIFCGGTHDVNVPKAVMRHHGVKEEETAVFRFRGEGWPGPLRVETKDGTQHDMTYADAWLKGPWGYQVQFRCKVCIDAVGEVADISVPDGWIMRNNKPIHEEAPGTNIAVVRTDRGAKLLADAVEAGYITTSPMSMDEMEPMHHNHISRRMGGDGQIFALDIQKAPRYKISGYKSRFTWSRQYFREWWGQFRGTWRRSRHRQENREVGL